MKLNVKHAAVLSLLIATAAVVAWPSRAVSQQQAQGAQGGPKIATASAAKIFMGMKEKTDVRARLDQQVKDLRQEEQSRRQKVQDLQSQLELIKPDAPQYEEASKGLTAAVIEFEVWGKTSQAQAALNEKRQTKMLFDKITAVIAEVAKERGIDFVVAEQPAFAVERMTPQELQQAMAQRQVLYANASLDLTQEVITRLDERYNTQKK